MNMSSVSHLEYYIAHNLIQNPEWKFDRKAFINALENSYGMTAAEPDTSPCIWVSTRRGHGISLDRTLALIREISAADYKLKGQYRCLSQAEVSIKPLSLFP